MNVDWTKLLNLLTSVDTSVLIQFDSDYGRLLYILMCVVSRSIIVFLLEKALEVITRSV